MGHVVGMHDGVGEEGDMSMMMGVMGVIAGGVSEEHIMHEEDDEGSDGEYRPGDGDDDDDD